MDSALSTLGFVIFGFTFSIYAILVESQLQNVSFAIVSPPSPPQPRPSYPPASSPLLRSPSSSSTPRPHRSPAPPRHHPHESHGPKDRKSPPRPSRRHNRRPPPPPPIPPHRMNGGKKIGLLFAGIAGIMQIVVVGFLVFKRRQLLKTKDVFETRS